MRRILSIGAVVLVFVITAVVVHSIIFREYELNKLETNPGVKLMKNLLTENIRVVDSESGHTIFSYPDGFGMVLENIEKQPNGEWQITIRDHSPIK